MIVQAIRKQVYNGKKIVTVRVYQAFIRTDNGIVLVHGKNHTDAMSRLLEIICPR